MNLSYMSRARSVGRRLMTLTKFRLIFIVCSGLLLLLVAGLRIVVGPAIDQSQKPVTIDLSRAAIQVLVPTSGEALYVGASGLNQPGGIYRSDDDGQTWQLVCSGPGLAIKALVVHPEEADSLYAGTAGGPAGLADSLWRSHDGGLTWQTFRTNLPANSYGLTPGVTALAFDPNQPEILYIGTDGQGIYRFNELQAENFERLNDGLPMRAHVTALAVGHDSRVYALVNQILFVLRDGRWQAVESLPGPAISLAVAPDDAQVLYVGSPASGLYRSSDAGISWRPVGSGLGLIPGAPLYVTALAVDKQNSGHVVAGTAYLVGSQLVGGGVYRRVEPDEPWVRLVQVEGLVSGIIINQGTLHIATTKGLLRYEEMAHS